MATIQEPPVSYITREDDLFFHVTEYDGDDLEVQIEHECAIDKLGYMVVFHAVTLDQRLSHGAFRLYILYHYWSLQKGRAWPSLVTIAKHLGVSKSSVVAYNKELESAGYIYRRARKSDDGHRLSSLVTIRSLKGNEHLSKLAATIFIKERGLELVEGGGQPTDHHGQQAERGGQPVGQEELTIEEVNTEEGAAMPPSTSSSVYSKPYSYEVYYRDKTEVTAIGTVSDGPWGIHCPACKEQVIIQKLNVPYECLCGMHEITLLPKKSPAKPIARKHEAVEMYYSIVRARGVKYGSNEAYENDIAMHVTDIPFWQQVVKEYIHPNVGGNPNAVDKMLVYYNEHRLPGTRKPKEPEDNPSKRYTLIEDEPIDEEPAVGGTLDMQAIRREFIEEQRKKGVVVNL